MAKQIEVWRDETSDHDEPQWVVSLCETTDGTEQCLSAHGEMEFAIVSGIAESRKRNLPLVVAKDGPVGSFFGDLHDYYTGVHISPAMDDEQDEGRAAAQYALRRRLDHYAE